MRLSKGLAGLVLGVSLPVLAFASYSSSESEVPEQEIAAFYTSFASNNGGLPEFGGRFRTGFFEAEVMSLNNSFGIEAGYTHRFELSRWFVPRAIAGVAYAFNNFNVVPAIGFTFPLVPIGGTFIGLSLDTYFYLSFGKGGNMVNPVIPLSVVFIF